MSDPIRAPINAEAALGAALAPAEFSWSAATVALYHLGIGAGAEGPGSDPEYLLESRLSPLPTFASLCCFPALIHLDRVPGLEGIDLARVLHGEHEIELAGPIPPAGRVRTEGTVEAVRDKGSGALIDVRQESRLEDGSLAWVNRYAMFARDCGGFESSSPPPERTARKMAPPRQPDAVATVATLPQQAALFRHSGDDNPLHLDPGYARSGGFDVPILQGLCSLGIAVRTIVDQHFEGEVGGVRRVGARFSGVVVPGEALRIESWRLRDAVAFNVTTEAGSIALGRGEIAA